MVFSGCFLRAVLISMIGRLEFEFTISVRVGRGGCLFAGRVLETATVGRLMEAPQHPYTAALFAATPRYDRPDQPLIAIPAGLREQLFAESAALDHKGGRHV